MKKLYKSKDDRMVSGVIGGIAEYFGIDSTLLRLIYAVVLFVGVGSPVLLYIILAIVMPESKIERKKPEHYNNKGYYKTTASRKRAPKEAEKVKDDDWSDF